MVHLGGIYDLPSVVIDDEDGWAAIMSAVGGFKISENTMPPGSRVADFCHEIWKIYFELKILEKSTFDYAEEFDKNFAYQSDLEIDRIVKQRLQNTISSANDQIKSTKKFFGNFDYQGVLIIVNVGMSDIFTEKIIHIIRRIIFNSERYRSINVILYLTKSQEQILENLSISQNLTIHRKSSHRVTSELMTDFMKNIKIILNNQNFSHPNDFEGAAIDRYIDSMGSKVEQRYRHD